MATIPPAYYDYLVKVRLGFPGPNQPSAATALQSDIKSAIQADTTNIGAASVDVSVYVPAGSGE
jgi:hypothetical protein